MNSGTSQDKPICGSRRHDVIQVDSELIAEIRQELADSQSRVNSLRIELQRVENDVYKVDRLWNVLSREKRSKKKVTVVAYLVISSIVPDILKWFFRPLTRSIRRISRRLDSSWKVGAYQVRPVTSSQPRKRVLHAIANFMTGGSSRLVIDIVENIGHIYYQEVLTGFIPAPSAYQGIAVCESRNPYEIVAFLKKFQPDVLHVHYWGDVDFGWYDKVFRAAEEVGCRVVENVNTPVVPYRSQLVRRYVYVSDYVMQSFSRPGENSAVIHPGSDLEFFSQKSIDKAEENVIGMVYRLEPDKLSLQSIDVFIKVAKCRPTTKVIIVGDGSFLDSYKKTVLTQGVENSFIFMGAAAYADLPSIYKQMSIFVAPVWKESFGQVSPFAMSMGLPVVGYRVGGLEEIVDDDDLLAPVGDSERLASIIIKLLDDRELRQSIGRKNQLRAQSLFSVEQMISKYEALYRSVIDEYV